MPQDKMGSVFLDWLRNQKTDAGAEHAQYLHFGATSQDITDTALMLRLRQLLGLQETAIKSTIAHLRKLATDHAETPMVPAPTDNLPR